MTFLDALILIIHVEDLLLHLSGLWVANKNKWYANWSAAAAVDNDDDVDKIDRSA